MRALSSGAQCPSAIELEFSIKIQQRSADLLTSIAATFRAEIAQRLAIFSAAAAASETLKDPKICPVPSCPFVGATMSAVREHLAARHRSDAAESSSFNSLPSIGGGTCALSAAWELLRPLLTNGTVMAEELKRALTDPSSANTLALATAANVEPGTPASPVAVINNLILGSEGLWDKLCPEYSQFFLQCPNCAAAEEVVQPAEILSVLGAMADVRGTLADVRALEQEFQWSAAVPCPQCGELRPARETVTQLAPYVLLTPSAGSCMGFEALPASTVIGGRFARLEGVVVAVAKDLPPLQQHFLTIRRVGSQWREFGSPPLARVVGLADINPHLVVLALFALSPLRGAPPPVAADLTTLSRIAEGTILQMGLQATAPTILSWNARSISSKVPALLHAAAESQVLCLQETWELDEPAQGLLQKEFDLHWQQRADGRGGVAVAVRRSFSQSVQLPPLVLQDVECLGVELVEPQLRVATIYVRPVLSTRTNLATALDRIVAVWEPHILAGDLNAHIPWLDGSPGDARGNEVRDFLRSHPEYMLIEPTSPTHVGGGILDVFLVRLPLLDGRFACSGLEARALHDRIGSDHHPIVLTTKYDGQQQFRSVGGPHRVARIIWSKVSNKHLREAQEEISFFRLRQRGSVNVQAAHFTNVLRRASRTFPRGCHFPHVQHATSTAAELSRIARKGSWQLWQVEDVPTQRCPLNGISSERLQAESFCKTFASKHDGPESVLQCPGLLPMEPPISITEVDAAIAQHPRGSAPDADDITGELLQSLPANARRFLMGLFNKCLTEGVIPTRWRNSIVTPVLKHNKSPLLVESYRPVAITSLLCRTLERIIKMRLIATFERELDPHQYGFLPGRCTALPLVHLISAAQEGLRMRTRAGASSQSSDARRTAQHKSLIVALDLSDAFCKVLADSACDTLTKWLCPAAVVRWIRVFLQQRSIRVRHRQWVSSRRSTSRGVPQGSVLGPMIWLLVANSLAVDVHTKWPCAVTARGVHGDFALYADDVSLWFTGPDPKSLSVAASLILKHVGNWAERNEIPISTKSVALIVAGVKSAVRAEEWPPLQCRGVQITPGITTIRVLGVDIDSSLSFADHAARLRNTLGGLLERLKRCAHFLGPSALRGLYFGVGLSRLLYAAPIWWPLLRTCDAESLERLHATFARVISGTMRTARTAACLAEARLRPLAATVAKYAFRLAAKTLRLRKCPALTFLLSPPTPVTSGAGAAVVVGPLQDSFQSLWLSPLRSLATKREPAHHGLITHAPPHRVRFRLQPDCAASADNATKLACSTVAASFVAADYELWTDGSVTSEGSRGVALLYRGLLPLSTTFIDPGPHACSFTAEMQAILIGIQQLALQPLLASETCLVGSDSLSSLSTLALGPLRQRCFAGAQIWQTLLTLQCAVTFLFVFSHCGVERNEAADLASQQRAPVPLAAEWWVDEARAAWSPVVRASDQEAWATGGFRKSLVLNSDSWLLPFATGLSAGDQRLLAQLRTGCCGSLGGWRHEAPEPCPFCHQPGVLARGGEAVAHVFACPTTQWAARRIALGISGCAALVADPAAAVAYVREFLGEKSKM